MAVHGNGKSTFMSVVKYVKDAQLQRRSMLACSCNEANELSHCFYRITLSCIPNPSDRNTLSSSFPIEPTARLVLYRARPALQHHSSTTFFPAHQAPNQRIPITYNPSTAHIQTLSHFPLLPRSNPSIVSAQELHQAIKSHSTLYLPSTAYTPTSHLSLTQLILQNHSINLKTSS